MLRDAPAAVSRSGAFCFRRRTQHQAQRRGTRRTHIQTRYWLLMLLHALGAVLRSADPFTREKMFQIFLAAQLLGFILGGSAFLLRYDHV